MSVGQDVLCLPLTLTCNIGAVIITILFWGFLILIMV